MENVGQLVNRNRERLRLQGWTLPSPSASVLDTISNGSL